MAVVFFISNSAFSSSLLNTSFNWTSKRKASPHQNVMMIQNVSKSDNRDISRTWAVSSSCLLFSSSVSTRRCFVLSSSLFKTSALSSAYKGNTYHTNSYVTNKTIQQIRMEDRSQYLIQVISEGYFTGDQFMGKIVVLLFQTHAGLLQSTVFSLQGHISGYYFTR